ncbi:hypothetical protein NST08_25735 [Paenibacillus sp. FSL K6-1566]|jgi:hypothetical protein|uniref:hypothetical protein n=1 Tax=unclassified Paenibacillus TaxID=185978 RepID=UPI0030FA6CFA
MTSEDGDNFLGEPPIRFVILALFHICSQIRDNSPLQKRLGAQISIASVDDVHNSVYNELFSDVMHSGIQVPLREAQRLSTCCGMDFFASYAVTAIGPMEYPCWNDETAAEKQKLGMRQFSCI